MDKCRGCGQVVAGCAGECEVCFEAADAPRCSACDRVCDGPDLTHFHADANVDEMDLCEPCADEARDCFVNDVATLLGRPLTDDENMFVWETAHTEHSTERMAEAIAAQVQS